MQYLIAGVVFLFFASVLWFFVWAMENYEQAVIRIFVYGFLLLIALLTAALLFLLSWEVAGKLMEHFLEH